MTMQFFVAVLSLTNTSLSGGDLGLGISYSMLITVTVGWLLTEGSRLENDFVAIERIKEYCEVDQEAPHVLPGEEEEEEEKQESQKGEETIIRSEKRAFMAEEVDGVKRRMSETDGHQGKTKM